MACIGLSQTEVSAAEILLCRKRWPMLHPPNQRKPPEKHQTSISSLFSSGTRMHLCHYT